MTDSLRKMVIFILVGVGAFVLAFGLGQVAGKKKDTASHDHEKASARYTVKLIDSSLEAGPVDLRFSVLDPDGEPVTAYDVVHEKELHLIVIERDDPTIYQHLHPVLADGVWSVRTELGAGAYRLYVDTTPKGVDAQVLTTDFDVPGKHLRREAPTKANDTTTVDGYDVALAAEGSAYTFTVTKGGQPVALQPYLGAGGHLVGIRGKSLDYLHAHAMAAKGNTVGFHVEASKSGTWVLHLDFQVDGKVHDATFVQEVGAAPQMDGTGDMEGHDHHH